jgi:hypothetical protein
MKLLVLALVLLTGCRVYEVRTTPSVLESARVQLRAGQPATIAATLHEDGQRDANENAVVTVAPEQNVTLALTRGGTLELPLWAIMRECADGKPLEDGRLCEFHNVDHVRIGKRRRVHEGVWAGPLAVGIVGGVLGGIIGMGYCASDCTGWGKPASQVGLVTLGAWFLYVVAGRR